MFNAPKLTNAGKALYYDNMAGTQIVFTTIQLGSGNISGPIPPMTALVTPVVTIDAEAKSVSGQYAEISGHFSNAQLADGFYFREIGVFAADPDYPDDRSKDILYCYQNAYDTADYIPVASVETVEKNITIPVIIGDATVVSCTLSRSLILASMEDLDNHNANQNAHGNTFVKAAEKGKAGGVATLDSDGVLLKEQRPKADSLYMPDGSTKISEKIDGMETAMLLALAAAAPYSTSQTYALGAYCTRGGKLYKANQAISAAEEWTVAHWTETTMGAELVTISIALANKRNWKGGIVTGISILDWAAAQNIPTDCACDTNTSDMPYAGYWMVCLDIYPGAGWKRLMATNILSGDTWSRNCNVSTWDDAWSCQNPAMQLGVEYRTTERYLGKPVYCKTFDFGSLPNATQKVVTYGDDTTRTIRATAVTGAGAIVTGGTGYVSSFSNFLILSTSNNAVGISCAGNASGISSCRVTVWYTKSTD